MQQRLSMEIPGRTPNRRQVDGQHQYDTDDECSQEIDLCLKGDPKLRICYSEAGVNKEDLSWLNHQDLNTTMVQLDLPETYTNLKQFDEENNDEKSDI